MRTRIHLVIVLAVAVAGELSHAQTNSWTNSASGKWEDATKWSLAISPNSNQVVLLTNALTKTVTIDATTISTKPTSMAIHDLTLSAPVGSTTTLSLSGLTASSPLQILGRLDLRTGGMLAVFIPFYMGGAIVVDQAGVSGTASNGLIVGFNTQGEMRMNGGNVASLLPTFVGLNAGSSGTLSVIGGTNQLPTLYVGYNLGSTGAVWVTGDTRVSCATLCLGGPVPNSLNMSPGGVGQITISNGAVSVANGMIVGGYVPNAVGTCGTLTIAGGSLELNNVSFVGYGNNANGTVWLTGGHLVATNSGGTAFAEFPGYPTISIGGGTTSGQLTVSNGSLLANSVVAYSRLTLAGGTMVLASNLSVATGNTTVSGGALYVTNAASTASLKIFSGTLLLTNGSITADTLGTLFSPSSKRFTFSGGTLTTKGTAITNGAPLVVGDGTNAATFHLNGGFHTISGGLVIAPNALLAGCGTIIGTVTNQGTIAMTCPTVFSNDVVNDATFIVSNGATVDFYGPVVNNGVIDAITGTVNFHSTFVNAGIYLDADGDADGDGQSNFQEFQAGTSPTNAASALRITGVAPTNGDILIEWTTAGGRTNVLQAAHDLGGSFTNVSPSIILTGTGDVTTNYLDVGGATNFPAGFYRIRLVP